MNCAKTFGRLCHSHWPLSTVCDLQTGHLHSDERLLEHLQLTLFFNCKLTHKGLRKLEVSSKTLKNTCVERKAWGEAALIQH